MMPSARGGASARNSQGTEQRKPPGQAEAAYASLLGIKILRELLDWLARDLQLKASPQEIGTLTAQRARELIVRSLRRGLPIFDPDLGAELADALEALNAGYTAPLLQRKAGRRGMAPHEAARAELGLLKWVRWQHGLGRKVGEAEAEVAAAACCTVAAIQKWPTELAKVYPPEHIRLKLKQAEDVGRREAEGWSLRDADNMTYELLRAWGGLRRDLSELVKSRRAAISSRHVAKSRDR
jgi:hypothetical protein